MAETQWYSHSHHSCMSVCYTQAKKNTTSHINMSKISTQGSNKIDKETLSVSEADSTLIL